MTPKKDTSIRGRTFTYSYWTNATDPEAGMEVVGTGVNAITRFDHPAVMRTLEIPSTPIGETRETVKADEVEVKVYNDHHDIHGRTVFSGKLEWKNETATVELPRTECVAAGIRCHKKRIITGKHFGLLHPAPWTVPYDLFHQVKWNGRYTTDSSMLPFDIPLKPPLKQGRFAPRSTETVNVALDGLFAHFESKFFKVSFSLRRPMISHLSWDCLGIRKLSRNFQCYGTDCNFSGIQPAATDNVCGPWLQDLSCHSAAFLWGGEVEVEGTSVIYRNLCCREGISVDVRFDVNEKGMRMSVCQNCDKESTFFEGAAWRFVFSGKNVYSLATLALPDTSPGRNGRIPVRGGWHATNNGTLMFEAVDGAGISQFQMEGTGMRGEKRIWADLQLSVRNEEDGLVTLLPGRSNAVVDFRVDNVEPVVSCGNNVHNGIRRAWGSAFQFRPEHGGLSNSSFSINCSNALYIPADLALFTRKVKEAPNMIELVRYSLLRALTGGPQYGGQWEQAQEAAPSLAIAAGRIYQACHDLRWLKENWLLLQRPLKYILNNLDESGMYICKLRSGNSGSYERSCNAWDVFSFGHQDGYSGALAYRALRNGISLSRDAGDNKLAVQCSEAAERLKQVYGVTLFNPDTGWLAGWRSRDGKLHDYGFTFINGIAISFGLIEKKSAKDILEKLEKKRVEIGDIDFRYGLAAQLLPVPRYDFSHKPVFNTYGYLPGREDGLDMFGIYCQGLMPGFCGFYLEALSTYGFNDVADKICDQLLDSFKQGGFDGCGNGAEFHSREGIPVGYEVTLAHTFYMLLFIAWHKNWIKRPEPQWWPA